MTWEKYWKRFLKPYVSYPKRGIERIFLKKTGAKNIVFWVCRVPTCITLEMLIVLGFLGGQIKKKKKIFNRLSYKFVV